MNRINYNEWKNEFKYVADEASLNDLVTFSYT